MLITVRELKIGDMVVSEDDQPITVTDVSRMNIIEGDIWRVQTKHGEDLISGDAVVETVEAT